MGSLGGTEELSLHLGIWLLRQFRKMRALIVCHLARDIKGNKKSFYSYTLVRPYLQGSIHLWDLSTGWILMCRRGSRGKL